MLVTFHSKASTSITMFGVAAIELLKMEKYQPRIPRFPLLPPAPLDARQESAIRAAVILEIPASLA